MVRLLLPPNRAFHSWTLLLALDPEPFVAVGDYECAVVENESGRIARHVEVLDEDRLVDVGDVYDAHVARAAVG